MNHHLNIQAPLHLSDIPMECKLVVGQYETVRELNLQDAFELFAAITLKARLAPALQKGFDIYKSLLFPGLCFQVKVSHVWANETPRIRSLGSRSYLAIPAPSWSFLGSNTHFADWYLLFGIDQNESVYPFLLDHETWLSKSSLIKSSDKRFLKMPAQATSKCGRGYRKNKIWEYLVDAWPDGLYKKCCVIENVTQ